MPSSRSGLFYLGLLYYPKPDSSGNTFVAGIRQAQTDINKRLQRMAGLILPKNCCNCFSKKILEITWTKPKPKVTKR